MVWIRWLDPKKGDQHQQMAALEAAELIMDQKEKGLVRFGIWEESDQQIELEMATRTGILEALEEREGQTLRLVPITAGG